MPFLETPHDDGPEFFELKDGMVLGRQDDCDLVIADPRASKHHCRLENKAGGWRLVDMASANGTRVNGRDVSQVGLDEGDLIQVGDAEFTFRRRRPAAAAAAGGGGRESARGRKKSPLPIIAVGAMLVAAIVIFGRSGNEDDSAAKEQRGESAAADTEVLEKEEPAAPNPNQADNDEQIDPAVAAREAARRREREQLEALRKELGDRLAEIDGEAAADVAARRWAGVLSRYDDLLFETRAGGIDELETEVRRARVKILSSVRDDWRQLETDLSAHLTSSRHDQAAVLIDDRLPSFLGTSFEALLRSERRRVELAKVRAGALAAAAKEKLSDTGGGTTAARPKPPTRSAADDGRIVDGVAKAEDAASRRQWAKAARGYEAALAEVGDDALAAEWGRRRDALAALGRLKADVITTVTSGKRTKSVKIGRFAARPISADPENISLRMGRGEVRWRWTEIPADRLLDLFGLVVRDGGSKLRLALAARELGDHARALDVLGQAAGDDLVKLRCDQLYAAWSGVAVPDGGFILDDGRFYTPEDWDQRKLGIEARKLSAKLAKASPDKFKTYAFELREMGDVAVDHFRTGLQARYDRILAEGRKLSVVRNLAKSRKALQPELEKRRKAAFALIFDTKRYPYPYAANQKEVQAEVDGLVDRVRELCDSPSTWLLEEHEGLQKIVDQLGEVVAFFPGGATPEPREFLRQLDRDLEMRTWGLSDSVRKRSLEALTVNAEIKSSITPEERGVHEITNRYRMMMGLQAVKIDEALVLAARGHSQEMKDLGYFAHNSPVKERRTPSMRAQLAGWGGSCSENIARGSRTPAQAVAGWIGSSGHHRNILGRGWTHLGCGKAKDGFFWTQNFAKGASSKLSKEKIKPGEEGVAGAGAGGKKEADGQ